MVEHFRPLCVVSLPIAPFVFFAPLFIKIAPKGAIPPTLRNTELDDGELDEQKCTQKIEILPGPTKKWRIKRIDELDEFYCAQIVGIMAVM